MISSLLAGVVWISRSFQGLSTAVGGTSGLGLESIWRDAVFQCCFLTFGYVVLFCSSLLKLVLNLFWVRGVEEEETVEGLLGVCGIFLEFPCRRGF